MSLRLVLRWLRPAAWCVPLSKPANHIFISTLPWLHFDIKHTWALSSDDVRRSAVGEKLVSVVWAAGFRPDQDQWSWASGYWFKIIIACNLEAGKSLQQEGYVCLFVLQDFSKKSQLIKSLSITVIFSIVVWKKASMTEKRMASVCSQV